MLDSLFLWLRYHEGFPAYALLAVFAGAEYVCPPLPGDTITLFAIFLALRAGYDAPSVFVAISIGSILGSLGAYALAIWVSGTASASGPNMANTASAANTAAATEHPVPQRTPGWALALRRWVEQPQLRAVQQKVHDHASWLLVINRFVPGFRAVVFFASGLARVPLYKVVLWGGLSAALWNAMLFALGYFFQSNWAQVQTWLQTYAVAAAGAAVVAVGYGVYRWRLGKRNSTASKDDNPY